MLLAAGLDELARKGATSLQHRAYIVAIAFIPAAIGGILTVARTSSRQ